MRPSLVLPLLLLCLPVVAQERGEGMEFEVMVVDGRRVSDGVLIPVFVSIPVDQLRFVDEGAEQVAKVSLTVENGGEKRVILHSHRVAAPAGTEPQGVVTRRFQLLATASTATVTVVDEIAQKRATQSIVIDGTKARLETSAHAPAADAKWRELLSRAQSEKKPLVVFFRTTPCARCREFEALSVPHPAIERRLSSMIFATLPANDGEAAKLWSSNDAGVAFFDRTGTLRVRWPIVPDTTNFGIILDTVNAVAPTFERAVQLAESGAPYQADVEAASAYARLARFKDAREALARAREHGDRATRESAVIATALLDANVGNSARTLAELEHLANDAATPKLASEAWIAIGAIHRAAGATDNAIRAYTAAAELAGAASPEHAAIEHALDILRGRRVAQSGAIRILPLGLQVVSGKQTVRTNVVSPSIARVVFALDGRTIATVKRPPFSTTLDFGAVPERHSIAVTAFDRKGAEIGRDTRVVNEAGETFWLRLESPREGFVSGPVRVALNLRAPAARSVRRVVLSWNDAERAVLTKAPWTASVDIPTSQVGVLRAVAELEDGRTTEDAVLLNAGGMVGRADVQLVELPLTILSRNGARPEITPERIRVHEGRKERVVESVATAADTPLTVGLLIDVSGSMQRSLPDLQEAAIRFLQTILGERDRAFLVTFDTRARLVQPATSDIALLHDQIMKSRPEGRTALHDATALGLLQFEGIKGRRALVLFTDGADVTSEYTAEEVSDLARRVNVPIHIFAATPFGAPGTWLTAQSAAVLKRLARASGGTHHTVEDLAELPAVYARIEAALRAQVLAFVRTDPGTRENEWRAVDVEVAGDALEVFAPEGYYAAW